MSGLLDAILVGATLSLLVSLVAWCAASLLQSRIRGAETSLWRSARVLALLPLLMAPLIYAVPETVPIAMDNHVPLPGHTAEVAPSTGVIGAIDSTSPRALPSPASMLVTIYLVGFALSLMAACRRHFSRRRILATSRPARVSERHILDREAKRVGVRAPELRLSTRATTPFITGWQAVIVVPSSLYQDPRTLRFALVHELVHLARGDERDRLVGAALLTVFWFHWPLRQIERGLHAARELACDANALEVLGGAERKPYAAALIEMMRAEIAPVSAFGSDDRRHRQMRIKSIMAGTAGRQRGRTILVVAILTGFLPLTVAQAMVTERRIAPVAVELVTPTDARAPQAPVAPEPTRPAILEPAPAVEPTPVPVVEPTPMAAPRPTVEPPVAPMPMAAPEPTAQPAPRADVFTHTVTEGRISSRYGPRPSRPTGAPIFHGGTDVAAATGTLLHAPAAGVVTHAQDGFNGSDRWGKTVVIDHGNGWETLYAHMDGFDVEVGDIVMAGDRIGRIGETGAATGPHVHVEVRLHGERVNPSDQLPGLD